MKIISQKQTKWATTLSIISGIGALWLTVMWFKMTFGHDGGTGLGGVFSGIPVLIYYTFNSIILIASGVALKAKLFKLHSVLAIILGISVTASLAIVHGGSNLFINTVFLGTTMGAMFGGTFLVPMFLFSVYFGLFRGFKHVFGKVAYNLNPYEVSGNQVDVPVDKEFPTKIIPIIGLIYACHKLLIFMPSVIQIVKNPNSYSQSILNSYFIMQIIVIILVIILPIISLRSKNLKVYRMLNIIIVTFLVFFFALPLFQMFVFPLFK